jgi:acyl carrier protein
MANAESHRSAVLAALVQVREDKGLDVAELTDAKHLGDDLGLDSLDMATVVADLEIELDIDPFVNDTGPIYTVGDLVRVYDAA